MPDPAPASPLLSRLAAHHADTWRHSLRVGRFAAWLAEAAGLTPQFGPDLARAASLHDIGKLALPPALLDKPDALTPAERERFRRHAGDGAARLAAAGDSPLAVAIAGSHHERWDGSGYPQGVAGTAIPLAARLVSLVDVYDAIRMPRAYSPAHAHEEAMTILHRIAHEFDPTLMAALRAHADGLEAAYRQETGA